MGAIQPDVKFGSDTDDAVVLQGLTRQLSDNLHVGFQWTLLIINGLRRFLKAMLPIFFHATWFLILVLKH